ncbi:MAG: phosphoribosylanthranilate isomerase [Gammaproteobacteria bacterium]|nr:phosphoribosylanthranilate isomerase [Gammaproteobacteria bacterium]
MRTRIKVCGLTNADDAAYAARLGADAIGLVFYPPSPRNIDILTAQDIVRVLPAFVTVVALFVNEQENTIRRILDQVPIDCLQFHGDESPSACQQFGKRYIKAVRMRDDTDIGALTEQYQGADALLMDAYDPVQQGGTGGRFDWKLVPKVNSLPIILAGGLDANNVGLAIKQTRPYAVDVSSGVEINKGIKDKTKIAAFIAAVEHGNRS